MHIYLSGAGQLGSRYLQGLAKCEAISRITVVDPSEQSLSLSLERYKDAGGNASIIHTDQNLPSKISDIDLAIVATLSTQRRNVINQLADKVSVKNWILEKILAPSIEDIDAIESKLGLNSNAWVNTPRRTMPWYVDIKKHFQQKQLNQSPLVIDVSGSNWGLACNAIHFLDLAEWLTEASLQQCKAQKQLEWHMAKRKGFLEAFGYIDCKLHNGHKLKISCLGNKDIPVTITIKSKYIDITVIENKNFAFDRTSSTHLPGKILLQSDLTTSLVNQILTKCTCSLPTLRTSARQHRLLVQCLSNDLAKSDLAVTANAALPIT